MFDRVVVINLARRPERMAEFWGALGEWPFSRPVRFEAVDGHAVAVPGEWERGAGAWGCLLSHRAVLDQAIAQGVSSLLVMEDDARPVPDFARLTREFLEAVPGDWDGLMFGAQHLLRPTRITAGVSQCRLATRAHAYAVRGPMMAALSQAWNEARNDHADVLLAYLMRRFKVYAPDPLLIAQAAGASDISGRVEPLRFVSLEHLKAMAGFGAEEKRLGTSSPSPGTPREHPGESFLPESREKFSP